MDPLSIASGCAGLVTAIGSLSFSIHTFVRTCREARSDLDRVSRELHSLQTVLELIQEDAADEEKPFPPTLGQHVTGIVSNCTAVVVEIQSCITKYGDGRLRSKMSWTVNGQGDMEKLRTSLEAHKSALELALDMLTLSLTKEIKTDTTEIRNDTAAIKDDTAQILQEIARLQARLPEDAATPNDFMLQKFLEEMTTYTEQELDTTLGDGDSRRNSRAHSFIDEQEEAATTRISPADPWDSHQEAAISPQPEPSSNPYPWGTRQEDVGIPHSEASRTTPMNTSSWSNRYDAAAHQEPSRTSPTNASPWSSYQGPPRPPPTNQPPWNNRPRPPPLDPPGILAPVPIETTGSGISPGSWPRRSGQGRPGERSTIRPTTEEEQPHQERYASPASLSVKLKLHDDRDRNVTLRRLTEEEVMAARGRRDSEEALQATDEADVLRSSNPEQTQDDWVALETCAVMPYRGNLVLDRPVPQDLLDSIPRNDRRNEFTHWRFTAVTCYPSLVVDRNYALRPQLFAWPRPIKVILSFWLDPAETAPDFVTRWRFIVRSVNHLCKNFLADSWMNIVVHIHGPADWVGLDPGVVQILEMTGIKLKANMAVVELDGKPLEPFYHEDATELRGETVYGTIREANHGLLSSSKGTFRIEPLARWVHRDWMNAVGEMLKPDGLLLIDVTSMDGVDFGESPFLLDLWLNKRPLKTEPGLRTYTLRVIEMGDLLKQLDEMKNKRGEKPGEYMMDDGDGNSTRQKNLDVFLAQTSKGSVTLTSMGLFNYLWETTGWGWMLVMCFGNITWNLGNAYRLKEVGYEEE
ncbi:hypothetical protein ACJZ2D_012378 [Fusarium nematophilum]